MPLKSKVTPHTAGKIDVLSIPRRALNDRLGYAWWKDYGKLLVVKAREESHFLQLGLPKNAPRFVQGHAKKVALALQALAKPMVLP